MDVYCHSTANFVVKCWALRKFCQNENWDVWQIDIFGVENRNPLFNSSWHKGIVDYIRVEIVEKIQDLIAR